MKIKIEIQTKEPPINWSILKLNQFRKQKNSIRLYKYFVKYPTSGKRRNLNEKKKHRIDLCFFYFNRTIIVYIELEKVFIQRL